MNLLIIPWGTPHWSPKSQNMSEILHNHSANTRVLYLVPLWGLLGINAIVHNKEVLLSVNGINERKLTRDTAVNIRSWLIHKAENYDKIIFISYANGGKFWSKGAAGLPCMNKVKIVNWKPSSPSTVKRDIIKLIK
jgi:hypothetical protein